MYVRKTTSNGPRPFTGYLNFSPDIVSSDYAEPRAQSLNEQEGRRIARSKIGAQNTKILRSASRAAPKASKFKLASTDKGIAERKAEATLRKERIKELYEKKLEKERNKRK